MAPPIRRGGRFPVSLFGPPAPWDPVSELGYLRDRVGRLYDQITPRGPGQSPWQPDIEAGETEEFYLVKAELPGVARDNVELQVDEHSLSITGSVGEQQSEHTMPRRAGRFFYRTVLPRDIDTGKAQAAMKEGSWRSASPRPSRRPAGCRSAPGRSGQAGGGPGTSPGPQLLVSGHPPAGQRATFPAT
jgi:HSP20 family protein